MKHKLIHFGPSASINRRRASSNSIGLVQAIVERVALDRASHVDRLLYGLERRKYAQHRWFTITAQASPRFQTYRSAVYGFFMLINLLFQIVVSLFRVGSVQLIIRVLYRVVIKAIFQISLGFSSNYFYFSIILILREKKEKRK